MIEKLYEFVFNFRYAIYFFIVICAILGIFSKARAEAFWPPDMVPHVGYPEIDEIEREERQEKMS